LKHAKREGENSTACDKSIANVDYQTLPRRKKYYNKYKLCQKNILIGNTNQERDFPMISLLYLKPHK
jgi:hypothetical protein